MDSTGRMGLGERLWLDDDPMVGTRLLEDAEVETLRTRLKRARDAARRQRRILRLAWATVVATPVAVVLLDRGGSELGLMLSLVFFFALLVAALVGALLAVVFPRRRWDRWLFLIALLASAAVIATGEEQEPEWLMVPLGVISWLTVLFGGPTYLWARWRRERELAPVLRAVAIDLHDGRVMVFRDSSTGEETEVLPSSRVLWRHAGVEIETWHTVECRLVADRDGDFEPLALDDVTTGLRDHVYRLGRRQLGPRECAELRRHVVRMPRMIAGELVCVAVLAATLARPVDWFARGSIGSDLSDAAIVAVGLIVTGRAIRRLLERTRLRADLRNGFVFRVRRPPDGDPDAPEHAEVLPLSGIVWTAENRPSPWRSG